MEQNAIPSETLTLLYGGIVRQLVADQENEQLVNAQLKKMGKNIGSRLVDEYLATTQTTRCVDFRDMAEKVATVGLKLFLNATASVSGWNPEGTACTIVISGNPLTDFVKLPSELKSSLEYNNIIAGAIEGALEMINVMVECVCEKDVLRGDSATELKLLLIENKNESFPFQDD
jgi:hypothetical protein